MSALDLSRLATEKTNPRSADIDELSTLEMLRVMNDEDKKVASAVERILPQAAQAVDIIAQGLRQGGRLFYVGAGTSGRLGVLDAAECPPTYGTPPELVQGLIAGGREAMFQAQEGAEDSADLGREDMINCGLSAKDIVLGIAASGRTPYVCGALGYAREVGAKTLSLSCSQDSPIAALADVALTPVVGAEVVTGSTRLKAGTAQKMVLNMLSTGTMIKLGKVYGNLMVDVKATNDKLRERAKNIVMEATGADESQAAAALSAAEGNAKLAICAILTGQSIADAQKLLDATGGYLRQALKLAGN